jgi:hypothetical protein
VGDPTARVESERLVLKRRDQILERLHEEVRDSAPRDDSVVGELIAERRAEARRDESSATG